MKITKLVLFIALISCFSCSDKELPDIAFLDQIAEQNSNALYDWDLESITAEKGNPQNGKLSFKINRKVGFKFKKSNYILLPFFKKDARNQIIPAVHFLLIEKAIDTEQLKRCSFDDLELLKEGTAYYFDPN